MHYNICIKINALTQDKMHMTNRLKSFLLWARLLSTQCGDIGQLS